MTHQTDLEHCPFCGARAFITISQKEGYSLWSIGCDANDPPGCLVGPFVEADNEAEAIAAWNHRAAMVDR